MEKPCISNPASAPQKARSMSVQLLTICGGADNVRQVPTAMSPDKYGDFAFERPRLWLFIRPPSLTVCAS